MLRDVLRLIYHLPATLERSGEDVQIPEHVDPAELALGLNRAGGDPPKGHLPIPPPLDVAVGVPCDRKQGSWKGGNHCPFRSDPPT
jgi:hypothetical protein